MIWQILFFAILFIFIWRLLVNKNGRSFLVVWIPLILPLGLILAIVFGRFMESSLGFVFPVQFTKIDTVKLVRNHSCTGADYCPFLVVVGDAYFYSVADTKKSLEVRAPKDDVAVFKAKGLDGKLEVYIYQFTNPLVQWIAQEPQGKKKYYAFTIPEGSNFEFE